MSTLHTVNKSPFNDNCLSSCLLLCASSDSLLLIEDGVYGGTNHSPCASELRAKIASGVSVYALENDARARGKLDVIDGITLINDQDFVRLSCEHQCIQSWY
ncbi:sulfurtransferase complex subunit TusB [Gilvimarinus sp. DA14]|uniref:sulfurtransferase complex subunit TusB n=1 Tax=Gilvimarinus sp. DA14 TaxID=2956798 RepID=UPI0020B877B5|nr:sulfurtransferase complex subunit TusB [Gilvimarinus sp. DA14]UTF60540.1 sulfurtransferase complex subunit TusB [Gilvimarinus sp. DA14]